ncbi:DNA polymerase epsilon, catalytic subunit A/POL2 [Trichodelitschia bisporula]|uniref:DNA polymerase epsilon catalytic subunit n=1 Tax=Trichodelitschia bisporula TaxID=703511 RepID=A0A6G1HW68_9PEZI|nr:DNA polymerase epsilon, catalytic subunit A/POL2 [Trichodelitschia bisporula]
MAPRRPGEPVRRMGKNGNTSYGGRRTAVNPTSLLASERTSANEKLEATRAAHKIDEAMGFARFEAGKPRVGWLVNMHSTSIEDEDHPGGKAAVEFYFLDDEGTGFKAAVEYEPYFLVAVKRGREAEVEEWVRRSSEGLVKKVERVEKEDLSMPNHLVGYRRTLLKLVFGNVNDLLAVRKMVMPVAEKNKKKVNAMDTYAEVASAHAGFDIFDEEEQDDKRHNGVLDASDFIVDIREYDVPYHVRVAIDKVQDIRVGKWYTVSAKHGVVSLKCLEDRLQRADPVVFAFDIETTKLPLKFPDATFDQIMMISYMIDVQGFLITNREIVSEDISDFEYTPKPEYDGPFMVFNEPDERALLERFFEHIKEARPTVMVTYNGDFFDWPFVETRASILGIDMYQEIGFRRNTEDIYQSDYCAHMDAFAWVNRDSYLPQGSRGLKAVTVAKLGYDPDELDPELMTPYASERPQTLAEYSVSDAVATYYLYMKYVHPFIFSLCTIIPLGPDDVLRKGTGTLCEMLLMVQAYQKGILLPNKHQAAKESFWEGHLLESETYVGGHVESIEAGVFRADIPCDFKLDPKAIDELLADLDAALKFSIEVEEKKSMDDVENYLEVKSQIVEQLLALQQEPTRSDKPLIYHLDVASMYPNIMTTNRLQPDSMIQESDCAACDFNRPGKTCDRRLPWAWRGEFLPAKRDEYNMIRHALESERFPGKKPSDGMRAFQDLSQDEQATLVKKRLQEYSKKIYHKIHDTRTIEREAIICQRENPFYVDTVKNFRDRRYDFKGKQKVWKGKVDTLKQAGASSAEVEEAKKMVVVFDSLQLAHKVILNSFYGYVMRKGSRWYSMEMAGVTCLTGAHIIQMARQLIERIGRPLELDTDGIWCILPASFPENFTFRLKGGKKIFLSYPCCMLNHLVHAKFTNHQYQTLVDPARFRYETHSDNSIFFEVDGPYKAMILPTSKEEDKNLKKRYAVFNHDGSLAELKGFEVKRRGELKLIKIFQTQIFKFFLEGQTLQDCYDAVATVANQWLDVLHSHGTTLADEELIDLICENKNMAKTLEEYGAQKTTAITTARRLAEFLGEQMVKDKGLNCKYIISSRPRGAPVTERAIPVAIFSAEEHVKRHFLRRWLKEDPGDMDPRDVIDWAYYLERLGSVIQKLITIPAALQKVRNPVPRVAHPEWLDRRLRIKDDRLKQKKMTDMFKPTEKLAAIHPNTVSQVVDLEDFGGSQLPRPRKGMVTVMSRKRKGEDAPLAAQSDPFASLPAVMPNVSEDYSEWLKYQKQKWRLQKQARIRRRQLFGEKRVDTSDAIGSYFRNQAEMMYINTWQVLQCHETERPGEMRLFVLIDKKIHTLKVIVPRQLYLNLKLDNLPDVFVDGCEVEKVTNYTLPNGHPSVHLFKLTMPEQLYVDEAKKLRVLFGHPSVEGVYERQIPLNMRAVLELGSLCTFDETQKGVLGKGLDQGFDLSALKRVKAPKPYLEDAPLEYLYLFHVISGDKHIYAIFSTLRDSAYLIIYSKARDIQGMPNMDKVYRGAYTQRCQDNCDQPWQQCFEYQEELHFRTTHVRSRAKALSEVAAAIRRLRHEDKDKALMLVVQSPHQAQLAHDIPVLKDFPTMTLQPDPSDPTLPPLGWQPAAARLVVHHYLNLGGWISHLTNMARFADVPVGNLETHDPRFTIDVAYARRLQRERVVLWWAPGPRPDHAGHEKDDILGPLETVEMPSINNPGTYASVCIDLSVGNLAINTLLASALINEAEGSDSVALNPAAPKEEAGSGHVIYSDQAFATAGVAVLRDMVKNWWADACTGDELADVMVQHLVRWVESPGSYLYDRSLHYYVQMMSRKALQQLMSDFRRVGSQIVYASAHRILLQTSKMEVGNAYAYSQYILKTVKAKPIFTFLDLQITEYWDYLVWYDAYNYGGKGTSTVVEADEQPLDTIIDWQIATFLPTALQSTFKDWVIAFIELMHERKHSNNSLPGSSARATQLPNHPNGNGNASDDEQSTPTLPKTFTKPLLKALTTIQRRQVTESIHPDLASDWSFPHHPGSHLPLENPTLQLAKSLAQVLSLDRSAHLSARRVRAQMLALVDVREFSPAAAFANPSCSTRVEGLVCAQCCAVRDLDLCRDPDVLPPPLTDPLPTSPTAQATLLKMRAGMGPRWKCRGCGSAFTRSEVEERLVRRVRGEVEAWQAQDVKCGKCGRIRANEFMEHSIRRSGKPPGTSSGQ